MINFIKKIMPDSTGSIESTEALTKRYNHFCRSLTTILLGLTLIPLCVISLLSYSQYKRLLEEDEVSRLLLNAEQAENTIARFVVKLRSIIDFAGHDDRYHELLEEGALEKLFLRLQKAYPDFTDIEVINPDGETIAYQGRYVNTPRDYKNERWYQETVKNRLYISSLFEGFRGVPHFVVAVARKMPSSGGSMGDRYDNNRYWVMRVNIDGNTLQRYVETIGAMTADDIFLVDQKGRLQTTPKKYGVRGELSPYGTYGSGRKLNRRMSAVVAVHNKDTHTLQLDIQQTPLASGKERRNHLRAVLPVSGTPWRLVMMKEFYDYGERWQRFRNRLFCYFLFCTTAAVIIIIAISRSITVHIRQSDEKRQQFLLEAEHSDKLASIGRLSAGVAHEINNPLAIINQKAGLMEDYMEMTSDFEYKKEIVNALTGIDQSVERCKTITHRLLGFARHTDICNEEINIGLLLRDVAAFVEREATYSQIEIVFSLAENLPPIVSDRGQLQQVFLNILNNAIDAINTKRERDDQKSGGTISVSAHLFNDRHIQINIADSGSGMSQQTLKHIFEPFYTTKKTGKGTGLGLSISYGIIEKLGGKIDVSSEIGKGSLFTFTLPLDIRDIA